MLLTGPTTGGFDVEVEVSEELLAVEVDLEVLEELDELVLAVELESLIGVEILLDVLLSLDKLVLVELSSEDGQEHKHINENIDIYNNFFIFSLLSLSLKIFYHFYYN